MPIADRWRQAGLKACATGVIVASAFGAHSARRIGPSTSRAVAVTSLRTEYKAQPARPRCQGATPVLANPGGAPRRDAVGVRDPCRGERADLARKGGALWDSGRVASDQSTGVVYAGPALQSSQTLLLAGPGLGRGRRCLRVECDRLVGDGAAGAVRLDRAVDRAGERSQIRRRHCHRPCCGASSRSTATSSRRARTSRATACTSCISTDAASAIRSSRRAGPATTSACSTRPTTSRRC